MAAEPIVLRKVCVMVGALLQPTRSCWKVRLQAKSYAAWFGEAGFEGGDDGVHAWTEYLKSGLISSGKGLYLSHGVCRMKVINGV